MFTKGYTSHKELNEARESVSTVAEGEKMQDKGFTMASKNEAVNLAIIQGVDGIFYSIYTAPASVPLYVESVIEIEK